MVSATLKLNQLISWYIMFEVVGEDEEFYLYYHPSPDCYFQIRLDAESTVKLKQKRQHIIDFLNQDITLSGVVMQKMRRRTVTREEEEEWVEETE